MFKRFSTDTFNWILIIGVILLVIEVAFYHGGLVFTLAIHSFITYIGWKKYSRLWGKILFWIGCLSLSITVLNMIAVRFLLVAGLALVIMNYRRSKKEPEELTIHVSMNDGEPQQEPLVQIEPLFQNRFSGDQKTSDKAFEWQDINIHGGVGDRIIDLSNTVLPNEAVISIRHFVGNIQIYIPYEVEISILHSSVIGRANLLGDYHNKLFNQTLSYRTKNYSTEKPRVKIITSILSGDLEVKRI